MNHRATFHSIHTYDEFILWHSYFIIICIFGCKRKGWRMSIYFIRIKPKWTIEQLFHLSNIYDKIYFRSNEFWLYICIIHLKFSPSFGRGAGLRRRCGLRGWGCIGCFGLCVIYVLVKMVIVEFLKTFIEFHFISFIFFIIFLFLYLFFIAKKEMIVHNLNIQSCF